MSQVQASDILAWSHGKENKGVLQCHWCKAPCDRIHRHDDFVPIPFTKNKNLAKNPDGGYICNGCQLYHKPSVTGYYLDGTFRDRMCLKNCSWLITRTETKILRPKQDAEALYKILLKPPHQFVLSFITLPTTTNHLHCTTANDYSIVEAGTPLHFTIDNIPHKYTVNELEEALKHEADGKEPGVRALVRLLGHHKIEVPEVKSKPGRPPALPDGKILQKVVSKSGEQV